MYSAEGLLMKPPVPSTSCKPFLGCANCVFPQRVSGTFEDVGSQNSFQLRAGFDNVSMCVGMVVVKVLWVVCFKFGARLSVHGVILFHIHNFNNQNRLGYV